MTTMDSKSQGPGQKRNLHRSPNYPAFSLDEAISKARTVYEKEKRAWTTGGVIQKHLGYQKPSGTGGRALSALRQFGLLDDRDGKYCISEAAYHLIVLHESDPLWIVAAKRSARKPAIFEEVMTEYGSGLPSDETLRTFLITQKGFNPASVADFIRILRRTVEFAARLGPDEVPPQVPTSPQIRSAAKPSGPTERVYVWPLSIPRNVRAELRVFGEDIRSSDIELLRKQIDLLLEATRSEPEPNN